MSREYERRTRHLLARVQAIVARMADDDTEASDFAAHLQGRLSALMRGEVAAAYGSSDVDLELILRDELLACAAQEEQVQAAGPPVRLEGRTAEVMTLAFHELATNAVKFGALGHASGRIDIAWDVQQTGGERIVRLVWAESGVPVVAPAPRREGFGHELLTQRIAYELSGTGSVSLKPGGLTCVITFPLEGVTS